MTTRGPKKVFDNKFNIVDTLKKIQATGKGDSRYLTLQLVDAGYVDVVASKGKGRGRPSHTYKVSGKGRGYLGLAKNWKRS